MTKTLPAGPRITEGPGCGGPGNLLHPSVTDERNEAPHDECSRESARGGRSMSDVVSVLGGTGALGRALALRLARSGRPVVLGSRDATRAEASAGELREVLAVAGVQAQVDGAGNAEAAAAGEIVLLATPYDASGDSITALSSAVAGRLVVSCINPLGFDARGPHGLPVPEGSAAEQVATLL